MSVSIRRVAVLAASFILLLGVWGVASGKLSAIVLPSPSEVWGAFRTDLWQGVWWQRVTTTFGHVGLSFLLIATIGVPIGIAMGRLWYVEDLLRVPAIFLQTIPTIAIAAIALIALGSNSSGVVFVTVASGVTYFVLTVVQGTRQVDLGMLDMARVYRASEARIVRTIVLPALVPYILAGSRIALGVAWHVALVAEYLMGAGGVGTALAADVRLLDTASLFSWGLTIVVLTIMIEYAVFRSLEQLLAHRRGRVVL